MTNIGRALTDATLHIRMADAVKPVLRQTPEYEQARAEKRSRAWLDAEALSLGYALAEVVRNRIEDLDADAGV